jgi:uncharacterized protein (TIGR02594 family)
MRLTHLLAGALLCVLLIPAANAQTRHHFVGINKLIGCSDPVMRPCGGMLISSTSFEGVKINTARARSQKAHRAPFGLRRVMAEGAGRAVDWRRPRAWCGWWMRKHLGVANPAGNLARWWVGFGRPAYGPHVGAIVVWPRGHRHGHVGIITGRTADGRWIVKSGNDGHRVRERPRSVAGAIAFRWPA